MLCVRVAVARVSFWVDRPYDYLVPDSMGSLTAGCRVAVPFGMGNRRTEAIVLEVYTPSAPPARALKSVSEQLDPERIVTDRQLRLAIWMHERFFCTVYDALRAILPTGLWFDAEGRRRAADRVTIRVRALKSGDELRQAGQKRHARAPMQSAVLDLLAAVGECDEHSLRELTGASASTLAALVRDGFCERYGTEDLHALRPSSAPPAPLPQLSEAQAEAVRTLTEKLCEPAPHPALLYGVTGSGKTAVYIHLIARALADGKNVILLVPEIALTPQTLRIFSLYFGEQTALMHSSLTTGERYTEWKRVRAGIAHLVIGTRSAIFAPFEQVGLVILDEEQDDSYKSDSAPRYHAADIARYRCAQDGAFLLLGSATPSVVSRYAAETGRYSLVRLPERYNARALPGVSIVDMKQELRRGSRSSISGFLTYEIQANLDRGEQTMLFLNRRGTAKLVTCGECGYIYTCCRCSSNLTYHAAAMRLVCHHCGYSRRVDEVCPACGGRLLFLGDGTEKIESELAELFPGVRVLRVDTDTVSKTNTHEMLFARFRSENIPIMVGTQMITKGLDFPNVTLVGVLNADQSLYLGDYRAAEHTFSLLTQVIGRSGRGERPGRAVIQTYTPGNQTIAFAAAQDYDSFYAQEIALRRALALPPFTQIIVLSAVGRSEERVLAVCRIMRGILDRELAGKEGVSILGPAPYPVVRVDGTYRYKLTAAAPALQTVRPTVLRLLQFINTDPAGRGVSVYADLNPLN